MVSPTIGSFVVWFVFANVTGNLIEWLLRHPTKILAIVFYDQGQSLLDLHKQFSYHYSNVFNVYYLRKYENEFVFPESLDLDQDLWKYLAKESLEVQDTVVRVYYSNRTNGFIELSSSNILEISKVVFGLL